MNRPCPLALASIAVATAACADNSNDEAVGGLEVRVTTTGTPDPDGYTLALEGQPDRAMASTDTTWYTGLAIGDYSVTLDDVEAGCTVQNGATKVKYVAVGSNVLTFSVDRP